MIFLDCEAGRLSSPHYSLLHRRADDDFYPSIDF